MATATSIKDIKNIQDLRGAEALRGEFYLVANRGSAKQVTLGFTQEGTFSVEREYRDASQNQTVSGVKGLVFLDSATVSFETSSLQVNESLLKEFKGLVTEEYTDDIDGTVYTKYKEQAFVDWNKYIDTLDLMFEYTDGKIGAIRMYNVIDKSADSWVFNRTDDVTVSVMFEATIDENDSDQYLPYEILIEKESDEVILERASSDIGKHGFTIPSATTEEEAFASIEDVVTTYLSTFKDYSAITVDASEADVTAFVGNVESVFGKITIKLTIGTLTSEVLIGVTALEPVVTVLKKSKEVKVTSTEA